MTMLNPLSANPTKWPNAVNEQKKITMCNKDDRSSHQNNMNASRPQEKP